MLTSEILSEKHQEFKQECVRGLKDLIKRIESFEGTLPEKMENGDINDTPQQDVGSLQFIIEKISYFAVFDIIQIMSEFEMKYGF